MAWPRRGACATALDCSPRSPLRRYERTTKDAYLFHNKLVGAWCIGEGLGDLGACVAMCTDQATSPELIESAWEVYDHDLREFHSDERLRIRCVRGDGALRNRDGHWAKQSTNGSYYCGKSAQCLCGYCNGQCGPFDGCNCASCKMLDTSENYGNLELALLVQREAQQNKEVVAENEKTLKRETDALINVLRAVVQTGAAVISKNTERILNRAAARLLGFARKVDHHSRWQGVTDQAESLAKTLRTFVGEAISQSNLKGTPEEEQNMQDMQTYVSTILKDYIDFLHVKTHRNVTMTTYLDRFPGLTHFIYVDRSQNTVVAPCLSPAQGGSRPERAVIRSLKERVWEMHAYAQVNRDQVRWPTRRLQASRISALSPVPSLPPACVGAGSSCAPAFPDPAIANDALSATDAGLHDADVQGGGLSVRVLPVVRGQ